MKVGELLVNQTGIYRLTYEDLLAGGLDLLGQPAADIALTMQGAVVPITVSGTETFGPGSMIEFYGQAVDSLYTTTNVYTLWVDRAKAMRIQEDASVADPASQAVAYYMETALVNQDKKYDPLSTTGDPWYNTRMVVYTAAKSWNYAVSVDHYMAGAASTSLWVDVYGGSDFAGSPDHHVVVKFNGAQVASETFDVTNTKVIQVNLPGGNLKEGANTMTIQLPGDTGQPADMVYLDQYRVTYPRTFWAVNGGLTFEGSGPAFQVNNLADASVEVYRLQNGVLTKMDGVSVSGQSAPYTARFVGSVQAAKYYVVGSSAMLKPGIRAARVQADISSGRADYLIISHPNFIDGLAALVQVRRGEGLVVRVVDVMDIYDQYSDGVVDPQAIKSYIGYAAKNMGIQYVLLVGDDTYDYKNNLKLGSISFIPSIYMAVGDLVQYAPVDPKYVDLNDDNVPDLSIGRFAVRTTAELSNVVSKTLSYEQKSYGKTDVFASDWGYSAESDALLAQVPSDWVSTKAYPDLVGMDQAHNTLMASMNAGIALTDYIGHSDDWEWTWDGLFSVDDAANLTNAGRPTLITQYGCYNIYYVNPTYETLEDGMLNSGLQGAAAMFGSTTMTSDVNEQRLGSLFMPLLTRGGKTIGQALLEAKRALASSDPNALDVLLGWSLLGDPYLRVTP